MKIDLNNPTLNEAIFAFWQTIASGHPEVTTGDFPPDATMAFANACRDAYQIWLDGNQPAEYELIENAHGQKTGWTGGILELIAIAYERGMEHHQEISLRNGDVVVLSENETMKLRKL